MSAVVFEEVADAPLFGEALDEVSVGFAVLHFPDQFGVDAGVQTLVDAEVVVGEDFIEDVDDGSVLEGFVVRGPRRQPEPRTQGVAVAPVVVHAADEFDGGDEPGDFSRSCTDAAKQASAHAVQFNRQSHLVADGGIQVGFEHGLVGGEGDGAQIDRVSKQLAQGFAANYADEFKLWHPEQVRNRAARRADCTGAADHVGHAFCCAHLCAPRA